MLVCAGSLGDGAEAVVAEPLTAALGALLEVDPDMLDNGELAEAVVQLHRQ
jgi:hypothetical protein